MADLNIPKTTQHIGNHSQAQILAALLASGKTVLVPFGDGCRYDLAVDIDGKLARIQCKTGRINEHRNIMFDTRSSSPTNGHKSYTHDAEYFGVFCQDTAECYLVPVSLVGKACATLKLRDSVWSRSELKAETFRICPI